MKRNLLSPAISILPLIEAIGSSQVSLDLKEAESYISDRRDGRIRNGVKSKFTDLSIFRTNP